MYLNKCLYCANTVADPIIVINKRNCLREDKKLIEQSSYNSFILETKSWFENTPLYDELTFTSKKQQYKFI